ncbi:MAG: Asp-tRNA(Asn)/Glu-tRNA(Gln) amidotransferase subunit GatC [Alphaproteobacteria bacterium]|nr:Asp-tRNA(Asn)/Glu-tRNA(Gln) amidotransferase subunit GatC [Alphaproteobacteria bacterium]
MKIDKNTIKEMAFWVRVRIPDEEAEVMAGEFTETLNWIGERLKNPEINTVPPMVTPFDEPITLRKDEVTDGNQVESVLKNAPEGATDEYFSVPKMVE